MLTLIKINSIDVTSYCRNYEYERTYGDSLSQIELNFKKTVNDFLSIETGLIVEVWRGWVTSTEEKIFSGYIEKFEPESGMMKITALDKLWDLVRKEVNHVYDYTIDASAGVISEIFKDLVTTYGGLTADGTSVQSSGTAMIIQKYVCNHTDPMERCTNLAKALDWQFYYRADTDKVYFEPMGYTNNPIILTIGTNVIQVPKWNYDNTEMVNDLTVIGAYQEVETTKAGRIGTTTGFTTTAIALDYEPISVKAYGDANNPPTTLKTGGLPDSTETYDYYVDKTQKKIYPKDGTTFTNADYYEIRYSLAAPIPIRMWNQQSIDNYGTFAKTITYKDIRSVIDAENRATNYLARYASPFVYTTLKVKNASTNNLAVGQKITVIDNKNSPAVNKQFVINKYRIRWPADYDELDVGDKYWKLAEFNANVMEKLKRIEEDELSNQDIINDLVTVDNSSFNPIKVEPRYHKITTQAPASADSMIWGHPTQGKWGETKWTDSVTGWATEVNSFVMQFQNYYEETFIDTDFKSASTTADWDTTNKWLLFTSGQTGLSTSIDYNNGTITQGKLTTPSSSQCLAHYKLNGDSTDALGNYNGVDTAISYPAGKINQCASFNGTTSVIDLGNNFNFERTDSFSISLWAYFDDVSAYHFLFAKQKTTSEGYSVYYDLSQTKISVVIKGSASAIVGGSTVISAGVWYHIIVTYDGSSTAAGIKIYINNVLETPTVFNDALAGSIIISESAKIGTREGTYFMDGLIDDVRVYNYVLSTADRASIYNSGTGTEAETTAKFKYYLTADGGSHWEEVTNDVLHTFTNTGTDLRWKIVENASTTGTITKVEVSDYHV